MVSNARRAAALNLLAATGMRRSNYAPPGVRLLWFLGVDAPPPHFARFANIALAMASVFGVTYGLLLWLIEGRAQFTPMPFALLRVVVPGLLYGLAMAQYYAYGRHKYRLPSWSDLPAEP